MWSMELHDGVEKRHKQFEKKWLHELTNVMRNLQELVVALESGVRPEQLKGLRFVRSEPVGVLAIDQSGPGKRTKMVPLRLYVYPDETDQILHIIGLGDKTTQTDDIKQSTEFVKGLLRGKEQTPPIGKPSGGYPRKT